MHQIYEMAKGKFTFSTPKHIKKLLLLTNGSHQLICRWSRRIGYLGQTIQKPVIIPHGLLLVPRQSVNVMSVGPFRSLKCESRIHIHRHLHHGVKGRVPWCHNHNRHVLGDVRSDPKSVSDGNVAYFRVVALYGKGLRESIQLH